METLIKDVDSYKTETKTDEKLLDDWKTAAKWYSKKKEGKKVGHSIEAIENLAQLILKEILERKKIDYDSPINKFEPEKMLGRDKELYIKAISRIKTEFPDFVENNELEYKQPISSGNEVGDKIEINEILKHLGSFKISDPYVYLVGGLPNRKETKGDIDILIKKPKPVLDCPHCEKTISEYDPDMPLKFRILRMFPHSLWDRIHFLYDNYHGPFTSYVPLFALEAKLLNLKRYEMSDDKKSIEESKTEKQKELNKVKGAEASKREDKVKPFRPIHPLKGIKGRIKKETFTYDGLIDTLKDKWFDLGIAVQKKFDGVHATIHKVGDVVKIFTEEGTDVTDVAPTLVKEVKKLKNDFIVDSEIELWVDGDHQFRSVTAGVLNKKSPGDKEKFLRANIFDILWINNEDVHNKPYEKRLGLLNNLDYSDKFRHAETKIAKSPKATIEHVKYFEDLEASEGAMLKVLDFKYELDGMTSKMIKYKKELQVEAQVVDVNAVKDTPGVFSYLMAIKDGNKLVPIGRTFNTKVKAKKGDILTVFFGNLNKYNSPDGRVWYSWVFPRVFEKREDKKNPDNIKTADRLVKESGGFIQEEKFPKRYEGKLSYKKRFVLQSHYRGKSEHKDLRFEFDDHLFGFTLADMKADEIEEPVLTLDQAKKLDKDKSIWKADWQGGGEIKQDKKLLAILKARQPKVWLGVEGKVEPGDIGATKEFPGIFSIVDKGNYERGAQKQFMKEFFLDGKKLKGRFIFRKIAQPNGDKTGKSPFVWFFWKPDNQKPYIISNRAIEKEWMPTDEKRSGLPEEWENKIPKELRWWKIGGSRESRHEIRKKVVEKLKEKNELKRMKLKIAEFVLHKRWWKGSKVIRDMPRVFYDIRIDKGEKKLDKFTLDSNPIKSKTSSAIRKDDPKKSWMTKEGKIPPSTSGENPNKELPANLEIIDSGKVNILQDGEDFTSYIFKGKKLKGYHIAKADTTGSDLFTFKKSKLPRAENQLSLDKEQLDKISKLTKSGEFRPRIAKKVGCSTSTVYTWQRKMNLI